MAMPRVLALPAAAAVVLTVIGAWIDGSRSSSSSSSSSAVTAASAGTPSPTTVVAGPPMTSCRSVVHVGDSTSVGLIDPSFLSDPARRIDAQYRRVGVVEPRMEISGARSIVETVPDQINAYDAAAAIKAAGYEGCWVLALGTTDTANVAVGGAIDRARRIERMLEVIGDDPILWVTVKTLVPSGAWSNDNMQEWNRVLAEAQAGHPNLTVYDWSAIVQDSWFGDDAIHYTSAGYAERARLIADALALAFPA